MKVEALRRLGVKECKCCGLFVDSVNAYYFDTQGRLYHFAGQVLDGPGEEGAFVGCHECALRERDRLQEQERERSSGVALLRR